MSVSDAPADEPKPDASVPLDVRAQRRSPLGKIALREDRAVFVALGAAAGFVIVALTSFFAPDLPWLVFPVAELLGALAGFLLAAMLTQAVRPRRKKRK